MQRTTETSDSSDIGYAKQHLLNLSREFTNLQVQIKSTISDDAKEEIIKQLIDFWQQHPNPFISRLDLSKNGLPNSVIKYLKGLPNTLQHINLANNNLDDNCIDDLIEALAHISSFDISNNQFGNRGAEKLIKSATQINIYLEGNEIDFQLMRRLTARVEINKVTQQAQNQLRMI